MQIHLLQPMRARLTDVCELQISVVFRQNKRKRARSKLPEKSRDGHVSSIECVVAWLHCNVTMKKCRCSKKGGWLGHETKFWKWLLSVCLWKRKEEENIIWTLVSNVSFSSKMSKFWKGP